MKLYLILVGNFWKLFLRVLEIFLSIEYKFNLEFSLAADLRNFGSNDSVTAGQWERNMRNTCAFALNRDRYAKNRIEFVRYISLGIFEGKKIFT